MATKTYISIRYEHEELGDDHKLGCKYCRFRAGYDLPMPANLTLEETKDAARQLSLSIFSSWTELNAIVERFEDTIQKRWMKKNADKRREILVKAWPEIATGHRPDFQFFRPSRKFVPRARTLPSAAFLWPYLNIEDLQQRHYLLLFLNSRGRTLPATHRTADFQAAHLGAGFEGYVSSADIDFCCASHFLDDNPFETPCAIFHSSTSPVEYGKIVEPEELRTLEGLRLQHIRPATEGLVSLEIQDGIYRFLLACAKLILHDVEPAGFFLAPHKPEPKMPVPRTTKYEMVSAHTLEAAYQIPQRLDLDRFSMLVGSQRAAAEDHIYSLREDPSYFIATVREWREHRSILSEGLPCHCHACATTYASDTVITAYSTFVLWDDIYRKLEMMPSIDVQMRRANDVRVRLTDEDAIRWAALSSVVKGFISRKIEILRNGVPYSPRLRDVSTVVLTHGRQNWELIQGKTSNGQYRIHNLFTAFCDKQLSDLHGFPALVDEGQYLLETDDDASSYVDSWMNEHFSDLALLSVLDKAINSLQPWFDDRMAIAWKLETMSQGRVLNKVDATVVKLARGMNAALDVALKKDRDECDPHDRAFEYPAEKARTQANVDAMRKAEQHLDNFWNKLEAGMRQEVKLDLQKVMRIRAFEPRAIYRTPPWQEPETPTRKTPSKILREVNPNVFRGCDSPTKSKFTPTPLKEKIKTRGVIAGAHHPRGVAHDAALLEPEEIVPAKVKINKKAFDVLCSLLPTTTSANQPCCEIAWKNFLFAMDAIGLNPEKLYGSVWHFQPCAEETRKVQVTRSISFHEPKSVRTGNKITRPMVRTFGRRLKHAFGWSDAESMFEVEQKE